jgi:hypothetical protein
MLNRTFPVALPILGTLLSTYSLHAGRQAQRPGRRPPVGRAAFELMLAGVLESSDLLLGYANGRPHEMPQPGDRLGRNARNL